MIRMLLSVCLYASPVFAQVHSGLPKNTVYAELGGVGIVGSLNYERLIADRYSARVGYSAFAFTFFDEVSSTGWIVGASRLFPVRTRAARHGGTYELGVAVGKSVSESRRAFSDEVKRTNMTTLSPQLGYSYRPVRGGVYFRLSFSPLLVWRDGRVAPLPWFGVSVGGAF